MNSLKNFDSRQEYLAYLKTIRDNNPKIKAYVNLFDDAFDDSEVNENLEQFINDPQLSEREYIETIALLRAPSYRITAGKTIKTAENQTDRLYAKNPYKFVEEFLQNADDCTYDETPQIDITIREKHGVNPSVEFYYNERGFTRRDVYAITSFSESTKGNNIVLQENENGVFYREKTGRKGIGFKSVFSLDAENIIVHIRSGGFAFKLDNKLGRILPVWEEYSGKQCKGTYITVELVNPSFDIKAVYPEFRRLFCMDNTKDLFANSPFLFMHRLKSVHIRNESDDDSEEFITEYNETSLRYSHPFDPLPGREILSGIVENNQYYEEQIQEGIIATLYGNETDEIHVFRFTSTSNKN